MIDPDRELTPMEKARQNKAINELKALQTEKNKHAELREAKGLPPKIERGEEARKLREGLILGGLVDNVLGQIIYAERILDQKMALNVETKLRDGRVFTLKLDVPHENETA